VPHLDRIDAVPARTLACGQKEVDGGGAGATIRAGCVAKRLAKMSALGMRREIKQADNVRRR
jgi:hypothetical protein